jgi:carbon storage regulator CsrA
MLVLSRRVEQAVQLRMGEHLVRVIVRDFRGGRVTLGFDAPREISILREEIVAEGPFRGSNHESE